VAEPKILSDIKKVLGLDEGYTAFDRDIKLHIDSVFAMLNQLGVGPDQSFHLETGNETWDQFFGAETNTANVKTYVYLKVRLYFDPPATSYAIAAMERQIDELEWRLNVQREEVKYPWVDPTPPSEDSIL
jgi:hypothetical protein